MLGIDTITTIVGHDREKFKYLDNAICCTASNIFLSVSRFITGWKAAIISLAFGIRTADHAITRYSNLKNYSTQKSITNHNKSWR